MGEPLRAFMRAQQAGGECEGDSADILVALDGGLLGLSSALPRPLETEGALGARQFFARSLQSDHDRRGEHFAAQTCTRDFEARRVDDGAHGRGLSGGLYN